MKDARRWAEQLGDQRGKKVVFLSHCLLNENTRYLCGACHAGVVPEVLQAVVNGGLGIVQMPCPEQQAWGGVLKRRLLRFYNSRGTLRYRLRSILLPVLLWSTRRTYRRLARQVADQIEDYLDSDFRVIGIVGVDGSPSCGVSKTLDTKRSLELVGSLHADARRDDITAIVHASLADGKGEFIEELRKELNRRRLNVPFLAHDLVAELQGRPSPLGLP